MNNNNPLNIFSAIKNAVTENLKDWKPLMCTVAIALIIFWAFLYFVCR